MSLLLHKDSLFGEQHARIVPLVDVNRADNSVPIIIPYDVLVQHINTARFHLAHLTQEGGEAYAVGTVDNVIELLRFLHVIAISNFKFTPAPSLEDSYTQGTRRKPQNPPMPLRN